MLLINKVIKFLALKSLFSVLIFSSNAFGVGLLDSKYIELGGELSDEQAVVKKVFDELHQLSLEPRFDAVGQIYTLTGKCTGTWLGDEDGLSVILTAAHCVEGDNKEEESIHTGQLMQFLIGDTWRMIAAGEATSHFIGYDDECKSDIAIVKIPRIRPPHNDQGEYIKQPVIADNPSFNQHVGKPMEFVGYGLRGTESLGLLSDVLNRRTYGEGHISSDGYGCLTYHTEKAWNKDGWAFTTPGDSGAAIWQWRQGQLVGIGVAHSWGGDWSSGYSDFARIAPYHVWMKKVYPEINTVTRSRTITTDKGIELSDLEAQVHGTVYYIAGNNVDGPTRGKWVKPRGYTQLSVPMVNQETGQTYNIELRSQRQTWCGWGEINNGAYCKPNATKGGLKVWFESNDNTATPSGLYQANFSLVAKGWHDKSYNADIELKANILVDNDLVQAGNLEGTVTASSSVTTERTSDSVNGSVYYLPENNIDSDIIRRIWHSRDRYSLLYVSAVNKNTERSATVILRASRNTGCKWKAINTGIYCNKPNQGELRVSYHPEDNTALPIGSYDSVFSIRAHGWHSPDFTKLLTFKLDLEKETP